MDIFTTALTRVVPVPIKPESLKVKALLKDAATCKLKEDHDHFENHEYYFAKKSNDNKADEEKNSHEESHQKGNNQKNAENKAPVALKSKEQLVDTTDDNAVDSTPESEQKSHNKVKHLDLYV